MDGSVERDTTVGYSVKKYSKSKYISAQSQTLYNTWKGRVWLGKKTPKIIVHRLVTGLALTETSVARITLSERREVGRAT